MNLFVIGATGGTGREIVTAVVVCLNAESSNSVVCSEGLFVIESFGPKLRHATSFNGLPLEPLGNGGIG